MAGSLKPLRAVLFVCRISAPEYVVGLVTGVRAARAGTLWAVSVCMGEGRAVKHSLL